MSAKVTFLLCLTLLPYMWADEVKSIKCPDGEKTCPLGKTCKKSDGSYECGDLSEEEKMNKRLVPGIMSISMPHISEERDKDDSGTCNGTVCPNSTCCLNFQSASCCKHSNYCCPKNFNCCTNNELSWCCAIKTRCHKKYNYCIAGASTLSPAIPFLLFIFLLTTTKYFL